jgi:hypothetical protein
MRIIPNHPRLRAVALSCWALSAWCMVYAGQLLLARQVAMLLLVSIELLALLLMAVGVAFWQLSSDQRAGIVFDTKGLLLNLGHSSAFIAWDNIERVGVSGHRANLFAVGSRQQLGIALRDVQPYLQSYEERLPAARGLLSRGLWLIDSALRRYRRPNDMPIASYIAHCRTRVGYDVLIPEALLGGTADAFVELVEAYRLRPSERRALESFIWAG